MDESHFIHSAGLSHYGGKPFRPAWGQLDELKALLPRSIPWQAMSATYPAHMLKTVESKILRPNYVSIRISSNRPNTMYATHRVVSKIEELRNYDCFLLNPFDLVSQPCVLIFFDDMDLAASVSNYLDSKLPQEDRGKGIVRHYHSGMSEQYLRVVHESFTQEDGLCKILCAMSGESVVSLCVRLIASTHGLYEGVDFPDVKIVCNVGLPSSIVEALQRGGRVGRRDGSQGLSVIFYDLWALTIPLDEYADSRSDDPDRPRALSKPTTSRKDRAPLSCVQLVQLQTCLRVFFASYLGDNAVNGALLTLNACLYLCLVYSPALRHSVLL